MGFGNSRGIWYFKGESMTSLISVEFFGIFVS